MKRSGGNTKDLAATIASSEIVHTIVGKIQFGSINCHPSRRRMSPRRR